MAIPAFDEITLPVLKLAGDGAELSFESAVKNIESAFELTDQDRKTILDSGPKPLIKDRVSWALTFLNAAKLIERPRRAHFRITNRGREALEQLPSKINREFLRRYPEFLLFENKQNSPQRADKDRIYRDVDFDIDSQAPEGTTTEQLSIL